MFAREDPPLIWIPEIGRVDLKILMNKICKLFIRNGAAILLFKPLESHEAIENEDNTFELCGLGHINIDLASEHLTCTVLTINIIPVDDNVGDAIGVGHDDDTNNDNLSLSAQSWSSG